MGFKSRLHYDIMPLHPGVTGSCNLVSVRLPSAEKFKFIVDCGLFQEEEYARYNLDFPFDVQNIDFCLITHTHIDHVGRLPLLMKKGFQGNIYMSSITKMFSRYALADSYIVLKNMAKYCRTKELYSEADVSNVQNNIIGCEYDKTIYINKWTKATFFINGHLPGAAIILVQISYPGEEDINILFTGDYNSKNMFFDVPLLPEWVCNLPLTIVQESTYGNMESSEIVETFEENVQNRLRNGGSVLSLGFALGRCQEILYTLKKMQIGRKLRRDIPIYFDGKLAHQYTQLYLKENTWVKEEMKDFLPKNLIYVTRNIRPTVMASQEQKIVLTTSGMGTYGPAQVYIPKFVQNPNWLIQFTGYTTKGTLGSRLKYAQIGENVQISGGLYKKRAQVEYTTEFSAHAKADEMLAFLAKFKSIKLVLVNHGEPETKFEFAERIVDEINPKNVAILDREHLYRVGHYGLIKSMTSKFD